MFSLFYLKKCVYYLEKNSYNNCGDRMKYYAIKSGRKTGIFTSWDECKEYISGFPGAIYKSFKTIEEANDYLNGVDKYKVDNSLPTAYVDGSFNVQTGEYSFGAILLIDGKEHRFKKKFDKDEYSFARNVAGEIRGASFIINYAVKNKISTLELFYDYQGIESWYTGEWKANNNLTQNYQNFANNNKGIIHINFHKVKSHTGVKYNEEVDLLAKEALGI